MKIIAFLSALLVSVGLAVAAPAETQAPPRQEVTNTLLSSGYWSGYAKPTSQSGQYYNSVSATWQLPKVAWGQTTYNPYGYEYNTAWVGIGGWGDSGLIQMGTESIVTAAGAVTNYVWYELYPDVSHTIPYSAGAGDTITSSITCVSNCVPGQTQTWNMKMTDQTRGWTWNQNFNFASSMASAEWILETPRYGSTLPLNNYGKITFSNAMANGVNPNLSLAANSITMSTSGGQTSNPAEAVNGNTFSTCYGYGSFTPCTTTTGSVVITPPPITIAPTASLVANPSRVLAGQASTLSWGSTNATSCTGNGFTASGVSGSATIYPTVSKSYWISCTGAGGTATAATTINVGSACNNNGKWCREVQPAH